MPKDPELAGMDPTGRFSDRADDYVRYRPDYPAAAIDWVLEGLGDLARIQVADIGAGTGISSRQIADRGPHVIAVEPNAGMRASAEPHPRVIAHDGAAESTGLAGESVDLVLCAQAFHWFHQREAIVEFHRILRPGGRLALMWNQRSHQDPLTREYIEAIRAVNGEHPAETRMFDPAVVSGARLFTPTETATFEHGQSLDRDGLIGRAASASYVSKEPEAFAKLVGLLDTLYEKYRDESGQVLLRYGTGVWRARRI